MDLRHHQKKNYLSLYNININPRNTKFIFIKKNILLSQKHNYK